MVFTGDTASGDEYNVHFLQRTPKTGKSFPASMRDRGNVRNTMPPALSLAGAACCPPAGAVSGMPVTL